MLQAYNYKCVVASGAGTNMKVVKNMEKNMKILVVPLHLIALRVQLVVSVSAFVMVSTVWSVSCLLFFYTQCSRAQPIVK